MAQRPKKGEGIQTIVPLYPGEHTISMSNALARAGHSLSLPEKRVMMIAISKLNPKKRYAGAEIPVTRITAAEYSEAGDVEMSEAYKALRAAAKNLWERYVTFYEASPKRKGKSISTTVVNVRWVGQAKYHEQEGWIELHWWPALLPHLFNLRSEFTRYKLQQASALRSVYSWRLLELVTSFKEKGIAEFDIEDFALAMGATEKQKTNFANIRRRIIEPAIKELSEKDGWLIEWEAVKRGRKVAKVRFNFQKNPQLGLFMD